MNQTNEGNDRRIIGILSNSQNKYKYSHFTKIMKKYIEEDVGVIYLCNNLKDKKAINNHIKNILGEKYDNIMEKQQIIILSGEGHGEADDSTIELVIKDVLIEIKALEEKSFKKICVYINVDKGINTISDKALDMVFKLFEDIAREHDIRLILRFFMDEITNFCFFSLLSEIGYFVVEDTNRDNFLLNHYPKIVTSSNLFSDPIIQEQPVLCRRKTESGLVTCDETDQIIDEVSHDLKNVFATISGYSQLAMIKTESKEVKDYLKIILNNSLDIHSIFEKFHNTCPDSSMKRGIYSFNNLVMDSSEMAFNMKRNKLHKDNPKISISYSLNSQKDVRCDKSQINQVIMNIIDNGIHALDCKGNIIVSTYDKGNDIVLEIIDNGMGIDEFTQSRIFEPYFTTKKDLGMGLGLDIVKRTLENHGATISVESRLGVGTKFIIVFPAIDKELNRDSLDSKDKSIYTNT